MNASLQTSMAPLNRTLLDCYKLQSDPFFHVNNAHTHPLFTMPQWQDTLELVHHLVCYSKYILVINGAVGIGKTCFKRALVARVGKTLRLSEMTHNLRLTAAEIPQTIATQFGITLNLPDTKIYFDNAARELLTRLNVMDKTAVLLIDDAQRWSPELLTALFRLYALDDKFAQKLRIIFFARPEIAQNFSTATLQEAAKTFTHNVPLKAMNEHETYSYLEFCFQQAGLIGELPFSTTVLKSIYQTSQGVPGLVNQAAAAALRGVEEVKPNLIKQGGFKMNTSFIKKHPGRIITALTLTSIAAILFLLKQPEITSPTPKIALAEIAPSYHSNEIVLPGQERAGEQDNIQPISQADASMQPINTNGGLLEEGMFGLGGMRPDGSDPSNAIYPEQGNTLTMQRTIDATNEFSAEEDEATLGANPTAPSQPIPLAQQTSTATIPVIIAPVSQPDTTASGPVPVVVPPTSAVEAPPIKVAENVVTVTPASAPVEVAVTTTPTVIATATPANNVMPTTEPVVAKATTNTLVAVTKPQFSDIEKKLLARSASHFTLQVAGAVDKKALQTFRKELALENDGIILHTMRDGHDWYVLLYGDYTNQQQAVEAAKDLPEKLQTLKPWARPMNAIQENIRQGLLTQKG